MSTTDEESQESAHKDMREVPLSLREVKLLLRYGYPFEEVEEQLKAFKSIGGDDHLLRINTMEISMLIGDLVHSSSALRSDRVL